MAKIVANENAPAEEVSYSVPGAEFTLKQGASYQTDDHAVLVEAEVHPWLEVEYDADERPDPAWRDGTIDPSEDALASENSVAFDPEAVKRDREAVLGDDGYQAEAEPIASPTATIFDTDDFDSERDE